MRNSHKKSQKWVEEFLERLFYSAAVAFTISILMCVVCSISESIIYNVNECHNKTYIILFSFMFVITWVITLSKKSSNYVRDIYALSYLGYKSLYVNLYKKMNMMLDDGTDYIYDESENEVIYKPSVCHRKDNCLIKDMNISDDTKKLLDEEGIKVLGDLFKYSVGEMSEVVGMKGIKELLRALGDYRGKDYYSEFEVGETELEKTEDKE